jgi:predicted dehydrogenase
MIRTGILGNSEQWDNLATGLKEIPSIKLVGFYDNKIQIPQKNELLYFAESEQLLSNVDAVIALAPLSELDQIKHYVRNSKHVLFQPTKHYSTREANALLGIIEEANVRVQAGFNKLYHQAFLATKPFIKDPKLIVSNHYISFENNAHEISVLMDLLLYDLDLVLSMVKSDIRNIEATSVSIDKSTPDVINVRIEFNNRCVAQFNAGRIATKAKNEIFFFNQNHYLYADLLNNKASIVKKKKKSEHYSLFHSVKGNLICEPIPVNNTENSENAIRAFAESILYNRMPDVNVETMMRTYKVAMAIEEKLKVHSHV